MKKSLLSVFLIILLMFLGLNSYAQSIGPWNTSELFETPSYRTTDVSAVSGLTGILYESIDYLNNPTEVFAYYSAPSGTMPSGGWPAVVFVHGAGGTARADWVQYWNERGYAAISMDTEGRYPTRVETPNSGPHQIGVWNDYHKDIDAQWFYHAVALVSRANSLLRSFPEVNANKIGVMGISWGGTITSTVMGVDNRFRWATPIYGAGFLSGSDGFQGSQMSAAEQEVVDTYFAAQLYFDNVTFPTMWINGTNDNHFPLTCTQQSSQAVNGSAILRYTLRLTHNHTAPQALDEVYYFAEQVINGVNPMPVMGSPKITSNQASVTYSSSVGLSGAQLLYTTDDGTWNQRAWQTSAATISGNTITANIPANATTVYFTATDTRGLMVSSEYILTSESSTTFTPDPTKTYFIDNPHHNVRLAANGESEDAYTTLTSNAGVSVRWQFVSNGNGQWHIDRAAGGSVPRLRTDATASADMQSTASNDRWESFILTEGSSNNTFFITSPNGPSNYKRLQVDNNGNVNMVSSLDDSTWESFTITEAGFVNDSGSSTVVHITKRNATGFAIDGNFGAEDFQSIYLYREVDTNENQQWIEIDRGGGYYSYQKMGTDHCIDGGANGSNNQDVYLYTCGENNRNQHWQKVDAGGGAYKLIKRNALGYALNGGNGGANEQDVNLFNSSLTSQNLHWYITPIDTSAKAIDVIDADKVVIYPNPAVNTATIRGAKNAIVNIYDMNGSLLLAKTMLADEEELNLSALSTGVYYAQVKGLYRVSFIKILVE